MTQSGAARTLVGVGMLLAMAGAGCGGGDVPHGAPVLLKVYWEVVGANAKACATVDHDASAVADSDAGDAGDAGLPSKPSNECLVWSNVPGDPNVVAVVPAAPYQFNLVFDRVLDGNLVEDTFTDGGVSQQRPKNFCPVGHEQPCVNPAPVSVTWPDFDLNDPSKFSLDVWYNSISLPIAPAGSSYVYGRELPSYPSNTAITIKLDPAHLTSKYDEPMTGPTEISVMTAPFTASVTLPVPEIGQTDSHPPTSYWIPLQFTNRIARPAEVVSNVLGPHVHVQKDGRTLDTSEYQLVPDPVDPTLVFVRPVNVVRSTPGADGGVLTNPIWDSGSRIDVTIDADLFDVFGAKLGAAVSASFVACETEGASDAAGSCAAPMGTPPTPDAGAPAGDGGGTGDASIDMPADAPAGGDDAAID